MTVRPVFTECPLHHRIRSSARPLPVYENLYRGDPFAFLYESLDENRTRGRYSFLGGRPRLVFRSKGRHVSFQSKEHGRDMEGDPFEILRQLMVPPSDVPAVATFPGGAVGYFGYDMIRLWEPLPDENPDDLHVPDSFFIFPEEVLIFDHVTGDVDILIYEKQGAADRLKQLECCLVGCEHMDEEDFAARGGGDIRDEPVPLISHPVESEFRSAVSQAKEYIRAGDVFQVVLSRRFDFTVTGDPLELYKALRYTNPSPYMYCLNLDGLWILGSSPEVLVKVEGEKVMTRPLAGTRARGETPAQDRLRSDELLSDEKERAEHVMLVDLARNDIGRVCTHGSVRTTELLGIERYSRVMHLVSHVEGRLARGYDSLDVLQAAFPAGTVSGAPKVRAMQIIEQLEPTKRGIYAGAIGYLSVRGEMDMCISIRTIVLCHGRGFIQAGAGIVADSVAEYEYQEILNKAKGMIKAVSAAKGAA